MNTDTIKQEIEQCSNVMTKKIKDLDSYRSTFKEALKPFIRTELKNIVEREVMRNPLHTKELGKQILSAMKKELEDLLENSDSYVDETFADDNLWVHVNYTITSESDSWEQKRKNSEKAEKFLEKGIKRLYGKAGKILVKNKYATAESEYDRASQWQISDKYDIVYGSNYGIRLPKELESLINNYRNKIEILHDDIEKLEKLKKKLLDQEVKDLWEEA